MSTNVNDLKTRQKSQRLLGSFRTAVHMAQTKSRRSGVPNVYSINGELQYELPSGELTTEVPEIYRKKPAPSNR